MWDKFVCVFNMFPTHWRITRARTISSTGNSFNMKLSSSWLHLLSNWFQVSGKLSQFFPQQFLRMRAHSRTMGTPTGLWMIVNKSCKISFGIEDLNLFNQKSINQLRIEYDKTWYLKSSSTVSWVNACNWLSMGWWSVGNELRLANPSFNLDSNSAQNESFEELLISIFGFCSND